MLKELYKIAAKACQDVYNENTDLGTTEFKLTTVDYFNAKINILAIAGTNETKDWFVNLNLFSKAGLKIGAYRAANEIYESVLPKIYLDGFLMVCGHSKAGATAIAFKKLFGADYCITFAPARSLRYWTNREMENTTLFIDPDDPVSKVGFLSFGHPKCRIIKAKKNHILPSISDHDIDNWVKFTEKL